MKLLFVLLCVIGVANVVQSAFGGKYQMEQKKIVLSDIETLANPEYDYAVIRCAKSGDSECIGKEINGHCYTITVNGVSGVKCDYTQGSASKDCCGIIIDEGTVES